MFLTALKKISNVTFFLKLHGIFKACVVYKHYKDYILI